MKVINISRELEIANNIVKILVENSKLLIISIKNKHFSVSHTNSSQIVSKRTLLTIVISLTFAKKNKSRLGHKCPFIVVSRLGSR